MPIKDFYPQAMLAFSAYSPNLIAGNVMANAKSFDLGDEDKMTLRQFEFFFGLNWEVVSQVEHSSGASMTLFRKGNSYYLAVRGTDLNLADFTTDGLLAIGQPMSQNAQLIVLGLRRWIRGVSPR